MMIVSTQEHQIGPACTPQKCHVRVEKYLTKAIALQYRIELRKTSYL